MISAFVACCGAAFGAQKLPDCLVPDDTANPAALKYIGFTDEEIKASSRKRRLRG